jgi:hypothetical protein
MDPADISKTKIGRERFAAAAQATAGEDLGRQNAQARQSAAL